MKKVLSSKVLSDLILFGKLIQSQTNKSLTLWILCMVRFLEWLILFYLVDFLHSVLKYWLTFSFRCYKIETKFKQLFDWVIDIEGGFEFS